MDELLDQLKSKISVLLEKQDRLKGEHQETRHRHEALQREKKLLQEKHEHAIAQIERMIARLKLLEKP